MDKRFDIENETFTLNELFELMPVAMALIDRQGNHIALNQELASINGRSVAELINKPVAEVSPQSVEHIKRNFQAYDAGREVADREIKIGQQSYYVSVKPVRNRQGVAIGEMVALTDITQSKATELALAEANQALQYLANHDSLTGLNNSLSYYETCDSLMRLAVRKKQPFAALFIDLDHFKVVNDSFGHETGDMMLQMVARCMRENLRSCDVIGRIGGEEFAVFLPDTDLHGAQVVAESLRSKIAVQQLHFNDACVFITASIGVATSKPYHRSVKDIQRESDQAMYQAKQAGRNRVACFDE